jgi:hypothetical protein
MVKEANSRKITGKNKKVFICAGRLQYRMITLYKI